MFQNLFRVFSMFWSNVVILEHFGDKDRRNSQLFIEPARVDIHSQPSIDKHLLSSIDNEARERADLKPKFHIITEIPMDDFDLIFMFFVIVLGNTHFLILIPQSLEFLLVWREDPRLLQNLVLELKFSELILFMQFIQIFVMFCFGMFQ